MLCGRLISAYFSVLFLPVYDILGNKKQLDFNYACNSKNTVLSFKFPLADDHYEQLMSPPVTLECHPIFGSIGTTILI